MHVWFSTPCHWSSLTMHLHGNASSFISATCKKNFALEATAGQEQASKPDFEMLRNWAWLNFFAGCCRDGTSQLLWAEPSPSFLYRARASIKWSACFELSFEALKPVFFCWLSSHFGVSPKTNLDNLFRSMGLGSYSVANLLIRTGLQARADARFISTMQQKLQSQICAVFWSPCKSGCCKN